MGIFILILEEQLFNRKLNGGIITRLRNGIVIFLATSIFLLGQGAVPTRTAVFSSDSFSQEVGDTYIFEFLDFQMSEMMNGMRMKFEISVLKRTESSGIVYDAVYANLSYNPPSNRTWIPAASNTEMMVYNATLG